MTATCIRVPVMRAHAESVNLQFEEPLDEVTYDALILEIVFNSLLLYTLKKVRINIKQMFNSSTFFYVSFWLPSINLIMNYYLASFPVILRTLSSCKLLSNAGQSSRHFLILKVDTLII